MAGGTELGARQSWPRKTELGARQSWPGGTELGAALNARHIQEERNCWRTLGEQTEPGDDCWLLDGVSVTGEQLPVAICVWLPFQWIICV